MNRILWRAVLEIGFIIFLFYANLLMGEFTHSGGGHVHGLRWALHDLVTGANLGIAVVASMIGYGVVEFLRIRLWRQPRRAPRP